MESDKYFAREQVLRLLLGAELDEFRSTGLQTSLHFINRKADEMRHLAISLTFLCYADISVADGEGTSEKFFVHVKNLIGRPVDDVEVHPSGRLEVNVGRATVKLIPDAEDRLLDDWVWRVACDEVVVPQGLPREVVCTTETGDVVFYVE